MSNVVKGPSYDFMYVKICLYCMAVLLGTGDSKAVIHS